MPLLIVLSSVAALLLLILVFRLHAFLAFIIVSLLAGMAAGLSPELVLKSLQKGIGDTLGSVTLVLGLGAMLGKLLADSGAAHRITHGLVKLMGIRYVQIALMITGFVVGLPMFYNVGFVILVPLVFAVGLSTGLPLLYLAMPMLAALSVTHGYLPPHPSPVAIAGSFGADQGKTLLYGIVVAIPAILLAGPLFSQALKKYRPVPPADLFETRTPEEKDMPGLGISLFVALLPVVLIALTAAIHPQDPRLAAAFHFAGAPEMALLLAVLLALFLPGIRKGRSVARQMDIAVEAVKGIAMILLIIAGAGALKQVLQEAGVSQYLAEQLALIQAPALILAWGMAAVIRVCIGSATVAGLTSAGILQPYIALSGVSPELMVLATGAGSLMFSHINDSGFWMFKEYFNLSVKDTLLTWSVMETIVSVAGLLGVLVLDIWL